MSEKHLHEAVVRLSDAISESEVLTNRMAFRGSHYYLDQAVARYFVRAIATARVVLVAVQKGQAGGTEPLLRHLYETLVDLIYIQSHKDPDVCTALSILVSFEKWRSLHDQNQQVLAAVSQEDMLPTYQEARSSPFSQSLEEIASFLDDQSERVGGPSNAFREALKLLNKGKHKKRRRRFGHWSGLNRPAMIDAIGKAENGSEGAVALLKALNSLLAAQSHASPLWGTLEFEVAGDEDSTHRFPDPYEEHPDYLRRAANIAASLLGHIREDVIEGSGIIKDDDPE